MHAIASIRGSASFDEIQQSKAVRAAHQFEAVLLNAAFGSLETVFSSLPGAKLRGEAENYRSMGMQALTASLSEKGGIGIADMIARSLRASGKEPTSAAGMNGKSPAE